MDPSTQTTPNQANPDPAAQQAVPDGAYVVNHQPDGQPAQVSAAAPAIDPATAVQPAGLPRSEFDRLAAASSPLPATELQPTPVPPPPAPAPAPTPPPAPAPEPPRPIQPPAPAPIPPAVQPQVMAPPVAVGGAMPTPPGKNAKAAKPAAHPNSTQNSLQIAEVRDGIVIMNDGSFRSVVMVKSINFDLMSQQEQEAVENSYQSFLNSLYFPIQIFVRSQKVDLGPYIDKLNKIRSEHDNMLLSLLMEDYVGYIGSLSQQANIMDKHFYVVIPFFPVIDTQKALTQSKNFLGGLGGLFNKKDQHVVINEADLENAKTELRNRVQAVLSGLLPCGVQGLPLDTQELIELYYDTYNPDTATRQQLKDFNNMTSDVITKGQGAAPQPHLERELQ